MHQIGSRARRRRWVSDAWFGGAAPPDEVEIRPLIASAASAAPVDGVDGEAASREREMRFVHPEAASTALPEVLRGRTVALLLCWPQLEARQVAEYAEWCGRAMGKVRGLVHVAGENCAPASPSDAAAAAGASRGGVREFLSRSEPRPEVDAQGVRDLVPPPPMSQKGRLGGSRVDLPAATSALAQLRASSAPAPDFGPPPDAPPPRSTSGVPIRFVNQSAFRS